MSFVLYDQLETFKEILGLYKNYERVCQMRLITA